MKQQCQLLATAMLLATVIPGCSPSASGLEAMANQLSNAADQCLLDVRDKGLKYESSRNCRSLDTLHRRYEEGGGRLESTPCRAEKLAETARATAWIALAISKTGDPSLSLW